MKATTTTIPIGIVSIIIPTHWYQLTTHRFTMNNKKTIKNT